MKIPVYVWLLIGYGLALIMFNKTARHAAFGLFLEQTTMRRRKKR